MRSWHEHGALDPRDEPPPPQRRAGDRAPGSTAIGLPYDDLHCSFDKVTRCVEVGIDVLIDDSPVNIVRARDAGIVPATIVHPWNEQLVERDGVIGARDWEGLQSGPRPGAGRIGGRSPEPSPRRLQDSADGGSEAHHLRSPCASPRGRPALVPGGELRRTCPASSPSAG